MSKLRDKHLYEDRVQRIYASLLFSFCLIVLMWAIIFKFNIYSLLHIEKNNATPIGERLLEGIVPLRSIFWAIKNLKWWQIGIFVLNILCFIPAGMLLPFMASRKKCLLFFFFFPCALELFQLSAGWGVMDTTDIVANFFGGYIGCKIYDLLYPRLSEKAINALLLSLILPAFFFSVFVTVRTILYFPV